MQVQDIEKTVLSVLAVILKQDFELGLEITADNTDSWNSLKHIEIMFALEDEFGIEFSREELSQLNSLTKIVNAVQAKV